MTSGPTVGSPAAGAPTLFDTYVAIDWSAKAVPTSGVDSIWIAALDRGCGEVPTLSNPRTRLAAEVELRALIGARPTRRTLLGIDVGLGYPAGTAALFGLEQPDRADWASTWRAIAALVTDDERNRNNRFEAAAELNRRGGAAAGPFWGCPHGRDVPGLAPTKAPSDVVGEFRATERVLRAAGRAPMSMWQLAGAGSVGGQSLTAIPVLQRLIEDLPGRVEVWPFTTGAVAPAVAPGQVVVAEVWPTLFDPPYPPGTIRDAAQVTHVVSCLATADASNALARWLAPDLAGAAARSVVAEEGWVLGPPGRVSTNDRNGRLC